MDLSSSDQDYTSGLKDSDVEITTQRGSGPGGQHRNKTETCVVVKHIKTGITAKIDGRSQWQNKQLALRVIKAKLKEAGEQNKSALLNQDRKEQIGSGMRADKIRTYREKDDAVMDHRSNKRSNLTSWLKGNW